MFKKCASMRTDIEYRFGNEIYRKNKQQLISSDIKLKLRFDKR